MPHLLPATNRYADLPYQHGRVPSWLAKRMAFLGRAIIESIIADYGKSAVLYRLSDPAWFQSFGCVLGLDWHSSGVTPAVMTALQRAINPNYREFGIYIIGGKGRFSHKTTKEIKSLSDITGLDENLFARSNQLAEQIDDVGEKDGFELCHYNFIVSSEGEWALIQQAVNDDRGLVRRLHWHSRDVEENFKAQSKFIYKRNRSVTINARGRKEEEAIDTIIYTLRENPHILKPYAHRIVMPKHHEIRSQNVDLNRLGAALSLVYDHELGDIESLKPMQGNNPRTLQALALVSELIHGGSFRFSDPARFSFAHGGIDQHPFPVACKIYDETISILQLALERFKFGTDTTKNAVRNLSQVSGIMEKYFEPDSAGFEKVLRWEKENSHNFGGRSIFGKEYPLPSQGQTRLFEDHG